MSYFWGAHVLCSSAVRYYAVKNVPYGMLGGGGGGGGGGGAVVAACIRGVESWNDFVPLPYLLLPSSVGYSLPYKGRMLCQLLPIKCTLKSTDVSSGSVRACDRLDLRVPSFVLNCIYSIALVPGVGKRQGLLLVTKCARTVQNF